MNRQEEQAEAILESLHHVRARIEQIGAVDKVTVGFHNDSMAVEINGSHYEMRIQFKRAGYRLGFSSGVQMTVKAPNSRRGSYGYTDQARTFRTGKDGRSWNLDSIATGIRALIEDMIGADAQRKGRDELEIARGHDRKHTRVELMAAGLIPYPRDDDDNFGMPMFGAKVDVLPFAEAQLEIDKHGRVSIKMGNLTAVEAIELIRKLKAN